MPEKRNGSRLLLIGGAERTEGDTPILEHFVDISGGRKAKILVCGVASDDADKTLKRYKQLFTKLGATQVWTDAIAHRYDADDDRLIEKLEASTATFFVGGDQLRITAFMAGTRFAEALEEKRHTKGYVVGGTSAGAAVMGSVMVLGGPPDGTVRRADVDLGPGLGYLPNSIVDTHFNARGRTSRLLTVFAQNSQVLGIGLDEDTALDITVGSEYRVYGSGVAMIFDGRVQFSSAPLVTDEEPMAISSVSLHVLTDGYGFDPTKMEILTPDGVYDAEPQASK